MKLSSCYLEHLDSLGLRHAKRLKSWDGGYKVLNCSPLQSTTPLTGCIDSNASPTDGNIVYNLQWKCCQGPPVIFVESLPRQQSHHFGYKNKMVVVSQSPLLPAVPTWLRATFFCSQGWIGIWKAVILPTLQRLKENHWWPLTAFPLKVLKNVSSIGIVDGIASSSHNGTTMVYPKYSGMTL
jgi:hypothetical protein